MRINRRLFLATGSCRPRKEACTEPDSPIFEQGQLSLWDERFPDCYRYRSLQTPPQEPEPKQTNPYACMIQSVKISKELGRKGPYHGYVNFPD